MQKVLVVHGPNLNLLGTRQPEVYGDTTLSQLESQIDEWAKPIGLECSYFQSNHEGAIIDAIHEARNEVGAVLINGGALTHYSYALYDALVAVDKLVVEVHISNIHGREPWRRVSVTSRAADHVIYGRGLRGYRDALRRIVATSTMPAIRSAYGSADAQYGELRVPNRPGPHPVAVLIHGGFWRDVWTLDLMDTLAVDLTVRGWATWNIEYHRVGSGGGWPLTMEDVGSAFDHLAVLAPDHALDLGNIVAFGHSAGGQLALWSASRPKLHDEDHGESAKIKPQRVVALAPVADLAAAHRLDVGSGAIEGFVRRSPTEGPERYTVASPIELVPLGVSQLVVHGDLDDVVPIHISQAYVDAARAAGDEVAMHAESGGDHFVLLEPDSASWQAVIDWLG